jgi:hypothetical protein
MNLRLKTNRDLHIDLPAPALLSSLAQRTAGHNHLQEGQQDNLMHPLFHPQLMMEHTQAKTNHPNPDDGQQDSLPYQSPFKIL